ncbi:transposase [Microbulbifer sp. 2205BS26-8]|uniref:transposase n=1 Tax=Microbulbifer sp. 2205BS26-8 TaxID=3064386 RepID=UPI00273E6702|nr:transposase [Microbulbifer sp. 2205BS26-8]MDP5209448.1 transposase [Microbulbifer sp. 2205BS26-8]
MSHRCEKLHNELMSETVFSEFFSPASNALNRVRYAAGRFKSLPMEDFCAFGCLRHLQGIQTLREQIQLLFHLTEAAQMPVARSTYSDALSSEYRLEILIQMVTQLFRQARAVLPDRLAEIPGLGERSIYAVDGSYQHESAHYHRCAPKHGGEDNPKGHMMLAFYDVRIGAPASVQIETRNFHEMRVFKDYGQEPGSLLKERRALWVVDRAYVDMPFWDAQYKGYRQTVITRMKDNLLVEDRKPRDLSEHKINEGILADEEVVLKASSARWRLIHYQAPDGNCFEFLTNEMELEPGVVAFLYLRRWDEEKCFDTWKNSFASKKAWSKSVTGISAQAWLAIMTSLLLLMFAHHHQDRWQIGDEKSLKKQPDRIDQKYIKEGQRIPWHTFLYRSVSKISQQVIRFLKYCFWKKASRKLYERQLMPMLLRYT